MKNPSTQALMQPEPPKMTLGGYNDIYRHSGQFLADVVNSRTGNYTNKNLIPEKNTADQIKSILMNKFYNR